MASDVPDPVGLCARCRHASVVSTPRSGFWLCGRSRTDATFARYPRLPVRECRGFEPAQEAEAPPSGPGPHPPPKK